MNCLQMIDEWRKGCTCATPGKPEECEECTRALIDAMERRLKTPPPVQLTDDLIKRLRDALAVGMWDAQRHGDLTALLDEIERLRAENAALTADARRYRWLRDFSSGETDDYGNVSIEFHCDFEHYGNPDASIDAAMGVK